MRPLHEILIEAATRKGVTQSSRRGVLALAAAAPAAFGLESVLAQADSERHRNGKKSRKNDRKRDKKQDRRKKRRDQGQNPPGGGGANNQGDIAILNYALTLEHLEYAFYRDGLFDADDNPDGFTAADFVALIPPQSTPVFSIV